MSGSTSRRGRRWTPEERAFVRTSYPRLGPATIAKSINRSKSGVCKLIAEMKASGEIAPDGSTRDATVSAPPPDEGGGQDTLGRLRWVRDLLETQLREAVPAQAPRLAKEYRETLGEIDRLEAKEAGDDDPIDKLADALSSAMRGAKAP